MHRVNLSQLKTLECNCRFPCIIRVTLSAYLDVSQSYQEEVIHSTGNALLLLPIIFSTASMEGIMRTKDHVQPYLSVLKNGKA
jgi:hypothetical protein